MKTGLDLTIYGLIPWRVREDLIKLQVQISRSKYATKVAIVFLLSLSLLI